MRKHIVALSLIGCACSTSHAADLPGRVQTFPEQAIMVPSVYNWAGFYLGGYFGGRWASVDEGIGVPNSKPHGIMGGIIGGGNLQYGNFVIGGEADGGTGTTSSGASTGAGGHLTDVDFQATGHARVRAGYAFDQLLMFAAGGLAVTEIGLTSTGSSQVRPAVYGWTVGGGVDYVFWRSFILRAEYLYEDYGKKSYVFVSSAAPVVLLKENVSATSHVVRGAFLVKF
jgi:outer membrane immunogenic protein